MPNLDELKANLESVGAQLRSEQQRGAIADQGKVEKLQNEYLDIQAQINQAEVEGVTQKIASDFETIEMGGETFSLSTLAANSFAETLLRGAFEKVASDVGLLADKWISENAAIKAEYEARLAAKDEEINSRDAVIKGKQERIDALELENTDLENKRKNAADQLAEAQEIIKQKESHLDDLRAQVNLGVKEAIKVVNITSTAELEEAARQLRALNDEKARAEAAAREAAKIRVYDLQEGDLKVSYYTAKRADNDESITIPRLELAKYVVLSNEEAARFREEHKAAEEALVESVPAAEEASQPVVPELPFRYDETEEAEPADRLDGHESDAQVVGKTVEERLAALEVAVFGQAKSAA